MFLTEVLEKMKTHILYSITPPPNHAMYFAQQITNATDSYSDYVILNAFPQQQ